MYQGFRILLLSLVCKLRNFRFVDFGLFCGELVKRDRSCKKQGRRSVNVFRDLLVFMEEILVSGRRAWPWLLWLLLSLLSTYGVAQQSCNITTSLVEGDHLCNFLLRFVLLGV